MNSFTLYFQGMYLTLLIFKSKFNITEKTIYWTTTFCSVKFSNYFLLKSRADP